MAKNSVRDFDSTAANNTDIQSVDIAENCAPSGINNAIRELMADIKDVSAGTVALESPSADSMTVTGDLTVDTNTLKVDSTNNRVGVGTTSSTRTFATKSSSVTIANFESTSGTAGLISFSDSNTTDDVHVRAGAVGDNLVLQAGGSERMRIDSSGNVGIGTTSPSQKLDIATSSGAAYITQTNGTATTFLGPDAANTGLFGTSTNHATRFMTNNTERMRINPSGNAISIGKTTFGTAGQGYTVYGNTAPQCYFNKSQSGAVNGVLFYHSDSYVGGLNYNNTNTSLATSSDERLKDNIENSDDAGAKIDAMQVRQFDWKSTGEHQEYGFVAQELESVFAHAVHTDKEGDYKSVDYACLVPMLVKEIQSLRQRITDLENA